MFRSVCSKLIRNNNIHGGGGGDPTTIPLCITRSVGFLSGHLFVRPFSSSLVSSYLRNSCGLSETEAKSASKKVQFDTTSNPNSVLNLLESYGFSKPHISKLITKNPMILVCDSHEILKPKLDYLLSRDITNLELAKVLSTNPQILFRSIQGHFIPFFDFIKKIVGTDRDAFRILQRTCIPADVDVKLLHNVQVLREEGVPESYIVRYVINIPRTFMMGTVKFKQIVAEVKGMGFDSSNRTTFLNAIHVIASMSKSTWEKKMNAYRKCGWSEEQIQNAIMLHPVCMRHSEKKILKTMDYLVSQMGYDASVMAECPIILDYSLKRIIPRCSVYRILVTKGLIIKDQFSIISLLKMTEEAFLDRFVIKYEQQAPEILKVKELSYEVVSRCG